MTLVKICGITTLDDARQAIDAGADALGFNFWTGSPRYLSEAAALAIIERLPDTVLKVGVYVDEFRPAVPGIDIAQMHGGPDPSARRFWRALAATLPGLREAIATSRAEAIVIDAPAGAQRGGTGNTFDWALAATLAGPIVLAGGLGPDNVAAAIEAVRPWGVDACSRLEREPGKKDYAKVEAFIRHVRDTQL